MRAEEMIDAFGSISKVSRIRSLHIRMPINENVSAEHEAILDATIRSLVSLKCLNLSECACAKINAIFGRNMSQFQKLTVLDIRHCTSPESVRAAFIGSFVAMLESRKSQTPHPTCASLKYLYTEGNISDPPFLHSLRAFGGLRVLSVQRCPPHAEARSTVWGDIMGGAPDLTVLSLSGCNMTGGELARMCEGCLTSDASKLQMVDLSCNHIFEFGASVYDTRTYIHTAIKYP
eukprot:GHVO01032451.1.p1 GENE.GHVO01032451.1~~GHVO01032451.1.p1  ORF type:complete len:233 (+),score=57.01 GHVO01032451.1:261-959(+)